MSTRNPFRPLASAPGPYFVSRDTYFSTETNTEIQKVTTDSESRQTHFRLSYNGAFVLIIVNRPDLNRITKSVFPNLLEADYMHLFDYDENDNDYQDLQAYFLKKLILRPQLDDILKMLTLPKPAVFYQTLQQFLDLPKYCFQLSHENGDLKPTLLRDHYRNAFKADNTIQSGLLPSWPQVMCLKAKSIDVVSRFNRAYTRGTGGVWNHRVHVDGKAYILKPIYPKAKFLEDVKKLYIVLATDIPPEIRIAKLMALVKTNRGRIAGVLLTHIPKKHSLWRAEEDSHTVSKSNKDNAGVWKIRETSEVALLEDRKKWFQQVLSAIRHLHSHGVFWGNLNPSNIIIDISGNAWVMNFGRPVSNTEYVSWENRRNVRRAVQGGIQNSQNHRHTLVYEQWENQGSFAADREGLRHLWEYLDVGKSWSLGTEISSGFLPLTFV